MPTGAALTLLAVAAGAALLAATPRATAQVAGVRFEDRSAGSGLDFVTWSGGPDKDHILESAGNGLAAIDYDGDSWQDLYFVTAWRFDERGGSETHSNRMMRSRRDLTFEDVTERAGVGTDDFGSGACLGDYDNDGFVDLYVTNFGDDILFRNNGDGTFSRVTDQAGLSAPGWSTGASFLDADGDGDQDLFVAAYIRTTVAEAQAATRHRMWRGRKAKRSIFAATNSR